MGSYNYGKKEVCDWIRENFPSGSTVLDVGAGDGKWRELLPGLVMDAVEVYEPNAFELKGYRKIYVNDICALNYDFYDLIIFGDVIEHLTVNEAQKVIEYAKRHCKDMVIAVPFLYEQGAIYGNPYEIHKQADLTRDIFKERYSGLEVLFDAADDYCYYHKQRID